MPSKQPRSGCSPYALSPMPFSLCPSLYALCPQNNRAADVPPMPYLRQQAYALPASAGLCPFPYALLGFRDVVPEAQQAYLRTSGRYTT